jgi:hypothetical protein
VTGRGAAIQGGLAALGLLVAHFTWQREPERAPGAVAVIDATKADVTRVQYEDENGSVVLTRGGGDGPAVWLHQVTTKSDTKPQNPHEPAPKQEDKKDEKKEPGKRIERDLGGGDGAVKLLDQFGPMVSPRAFGVLDAAKLKELGLDAPKRKLEVTVKGDVRRYEIGQPANAAGGESFLRDTRDNRVYLMPRGMLSQLQGSSSLIDRKLHSFEPAEFDRMVISSGGKQKEYAQVGRESRTTAGFAPPKTPDKRDQMAKNWHDAVWRIFPADVLGRGETPASGAPAPVVRVDYYDGKKAVGWLELAKLEPAAPAAGATSPATPPPAETYARTEHTVGWVKLNTGAQLIADAQKLIATN